MRNHNRKLAIWRYLDPKSDLEEISINNAALEMFENYKPLASLFDLGIYYWE